MSCEMINGRKADIKESLYGFYAIGVVENFASIMQALRVERLELESYEPEDVRINDQMDRSKRNTQTLKRLRLLLP